MSLIEELYKKLDRYNMLNPQLTYKGEYLFQDFRLVAYNEEQDNLFLNSIVDKNGNRYGNFRDKYFYKLFDVSRFKGFPIKYIFPLLYSSEKDNGKGRMLTYSYDVAVNNLLVGIGIVSDNSGEACDLSPEEFERYQSIKDIFGAISFAYDKYKEKRDMLLKYQRNKYNSPYNREVAYLYSNRMNCPVEKPSELTEEQIKYILSKVTDSIIEKTVQIFTNVLFNLKYLKKDLQNGPVELSQEEFKAFFEPDKYYLLLMKTIIENQEESISENKRCTLAFVEVAYYLHAIDSLGLKEYNPHIKFYDINKKKIVDYSLKDLRKEFDMLKDMCPEKKVVRAVTMDQVEKMNIAYDPDAYIALIETIADEDASQAIINNWNILPSGTKEVVEARTKYRNPNAPKKEKTVTEDVILNRKYIFQRTNYKIKLVGRDKFSGYVGYIYSNGLVVFEAFYEPNGEIVQTGATYIMNYKNFAEFCKLTKQEIIEYIKDQGNSDVRRLYHKATWADNLNKVIKSVSEKPEITIAVDALVENIKTKNRICSDY